ncbi:MAG: hypothetical protein WD489_01850 [Rhodovibrionaceae bacterium]
MGQPSVVDLFPSPLLQWDIGQPELIDALLSEIMAKRAGMREMGAERVDVDFFDSSTPERIEFQTVLHRAVGHFIEVLAGGKATVLPGYEPRGVARLIHKGDFLAPWETSRFDLSGIVYLDIGDGPSLDLRGFIEFLDPRAAVKPLPGRRLSLNARATPQRGLLLLYPGWLRRVIYPYAGKQPRVIFDYDIRFRATTGAEAPKGTDDDR